MRRAKGALLCLAAASVTAGCGDTITEDLQGMLTASAAEAAGENCPNGGTALSAGIDDDGDGVLSDAEVDSTTYVCHTPAQEDGARLLVSAYEPPGENCPDGGAAVTSGRDANDDGALAESEVEDVTYICTPDAAVRALTIATAEPAGENCAEGGIRLDVGYDADGDGSLGTEEAVKTSFACLDESLGAPLLTERSPLDVTDEQCPGGYIEEWFGLDVDGDGTLGAAEQSVSTITCNALPRIDGDTFIVDEDCDDGFAFEPEAWDPDGTATLDAELLAGPEGTELTVHESGTVSGTSPLYEGGAAIRVTATDEWGASATQTFVVAFEGSGCVPTDAFHGVHPDTCVIASPENARDVPATPPLLVPDGLVFATFNGLFNMDRDLGGITLAVRSAAQTIFSDSETGTLYSLWSSEFDYENILEANLYPSRAIWDRIVEVDPETGDVSNAVDLAHDLWVDRSVPVSTPMGTYDYYIFQMILSARGGEMLVASVGTLRGQQSLNVRIFDLETGELVSSAFRPRPAEGTDGWDYLWQRGPSSISHSPMYPSGDGANYIFRGEDRVWREFDFTSQALELRSETFASTCAVWSLTVDHATNTVYGASVGPCFGDEDAPIELFRCAALPIPNDGVVDDSGDGSPFFLVI
jgi:hypothetical protein